MVGATPWNIQVVLSHKVLKYHLIQEIMFLYQYIILLAGGGSRDPKDPPASAPVHQPNFSAIRYFQYCAIITTANTL